MQPKQERVQKIMSNAGYCSRRKAEQLIEQGRVKVNAKTISLGDKASLNDTITIDGKKLQKSSFIYLKFNKPVGCVTALKDKEHKTIMHYIPLKQRIYPVGRLDYNTSGLLLLTNDGDFANHIMHPRYERKKTYRVVLDKPFMQEHKRALEKGILLEDGKTAPAKITLKKPNSIDITIHEGKNRIVRRMCKHLGYRIKALERIAIGKLKLGELKKGDYKELTQKEKELLLN